MTIKNSPSRAYTSTDDGGRILRIFLWIFAGIIGLAILCCLSTLVFAWFTGDYFVEFFRSLIQ